MSRYHTFVSILDKLRAEAPPENKRYHPPSSNVEELNHARSRAFVHLYLKVVHGLLDFKEREKHVTDDADDGGVDGYYIDKEKRETVFIQSKFRKTKKNFEEKPIALDEIVKMDADRMADGEAEYENGTKYNGKIQEMLKEFGRIADAEYDVVRAGHPNRAVGFQYSLAASQPFGVEFVVQFRSARDVPIAFIHLHHFASVTGDTTVREKVRRVGKDGVEAAFVAVFLINRIEQIQTVPMVEADEGIVGGEN
jgi:hypothetical protein